MQFFLFQDSLFLMNSLDGIFATIYPEVYPVKSNPFPPMRVGRNASLGIA